MKRAIIVAVAIGILVAGVGWRILSGGGQVQKTLTGTETTGRSTKEEMFLTITSPADGAAVKTNTVTVKGQTAPGAEVWVNEAEAQADAGGNFAVTVSLEEGENLLAVLAVDENGEAAERELTVTVETFE